MDLSDYIKLKLNILKQPLKTEFKQKSLETRIDEFKNIRRENRTNLMFDKRKIVNMSPYQTPDAKNGRKSVANSEVVVNKRLEMLQKWREEKAKKTAEARSKVKPIFKVCHVETKLSLTDFDKLNEVKGKPLQSKFAPTNHQFKPPSNIKPIQLNGSATSKSGIGQKRVSQRSLSNSRVVSNTTGNLSRLSSRSAENLSSVNRKILPVKGRPPVTNPKATAANVKSNKPLAATAKITETKKSVKDNLREAKQPKSKTVSPNKKLKTTTTQSTGRGRGRPPSKTKDSPTAKRTESQESLADKTDDTNKSNATPQKKNRGRPKKVKLESTEEVPSSPKRLRGRPSKGVAFKTPVKTPNKSGARTSARQKTPFKVNGWNVEYNGESSEEADEADKSQDVTVVDIKSLTDEDFCTPDKDKGPRDSPPMYISPFVTVSRGKESARKEYHVRNSPRAAAASPSFLKKDVDNLSSPKAGAEYFSKKLQDEINRIEGMCNEWDSYRKGDDVPTEAQDMIDVAIGQSKLLISKKFQQFRGLIEECRSQNFEAKTVTCLDLHGFWDMMYIQVEDLDKRFQNLQKLRDNNWEEVLPVKPKSPAKKARGRPPSKRAASSRLKEMIKAAREKKLNTATTEEQLSEKTFDGGYFSVQSPIKETVLPNSSKRRSLRMSVLANEARRKISSPGLTMMKVSHSIKTGDGLTPGKSILKIDGVKSAKKSVLFRDDIEGARKESISKTVLFPSDDDTDENDQNEDNMVPTRRSSKRLTMI